MTSVGAAGEVTGSLYVIRTRDHCLLLECGLIQGGSSAEERNADPFPVPIEEIEVGDRVITTDESLLGETEVDPETWQVVRVSLAAGELELANAAVVKKPFTVEDVLAELRRLLG